MPERVRRVRPFFLLALFAFFLPPFFAPASDFFALRATFLNARFVSSSASSSATSVRATAFFAAFLTFCAACLTGLRRRVLEAAFFRVANLSVSLWWIRAYFKRNTPARIIARQAGRWIITASSSRHADERPALRQPVTPPTITGP